MQPGPRSVITGDFNLHHSAWNPRSASDDLDAELLLSWMEERALLLGNADGEPTHESGSVIDLAIFSAPLFALGATAELRDEYTCGSDHFPMTITLPLADQPTAAAPPGRLVMDKMDRKKFTAACKAGVPLMDALVAGIRRRPLSRAEKTQHVDDFARTLQEVILGALDASTPRSLGKAKSFPWWDKDCREASAEQQSAKHRVNNADSETAEREARKDRREAKKRLGMVLKKAAGNFYDNRVAKATQARDIFQIVKWRTKPPARPSPALAPVEGAEATVQDTTEKIALLRSVHMPSSRPGDLPPPDLSQAPVGTEPITKHEVKAALWKPQNTAPGLDSLSNNALKLAWPALGKQITYLFKVSFSWGLHPSPFKQAKVIALAKPNKKDRSSPRSYRLISLLPTLAKCLERIVARRLSLWALEKGHIGDNYAGAVPGRSAEDMCLSLVESLEYYMDRQMESSVLTFDVKGAFDAVQPHRMVQRLVDLDCPAETCRWVSSFLSDRKASLVLDGVDDLQPTGGSLPQGSPISPILFMLFMAPLFRMALPCSLRGYADDGCLVSSGSSLAANCSVLSHTLNIVNNWCVRNGMMLDLAKSELLHVTRKRHGQNPGLLLPDSGSLDAIDPKDTLRWLGVRWSRNLSFVPHIRDVAQRTAPTIRGIQILSGCWKGAPVKGALTAVRSCVVNKLAYAAAVWWNHGAGTTSQPRGLKQAVALLDRTVRRGLRAALPLYCTTPCAIYNLASGFPPMSFVLDSRLGSAGLRATLAQPNHPLGTTATNWGRIGRLKMLLPHSLATNYPAPFTGAPASSRPHLQGDKKAAAAAHLALVRSSSPSDLWIYTDGSKLGEGRVGAGWAIIRDETVLDTGNCPIPFHAEVHDAEVMAIARALEKVDSWVKPQCRKVWVCSDNLAAVYRLTTWGAKPGTSEELLRRAQTICADWIGQSPDHPGPRPWPDGAPAVEVIWVPGHSDVWGNELADRQAKIGAERAYTPVGMSLSWARSHFRACITTEFRTWWSNEGCANRPHLSRPLEAPKKAWKSLLDDTERKLARAVLTALSGHGDYADYHRRFNHLNAVLTCPLCDAETTPEHIWVCPRNPQRMSKGFFQKLIATKSGAIWLASKAAKSPPVLLAHHRAVTGMVPQEGDSPVRPPPDPPPPGPTLPGAA
ncbi:uncharacterized protein BROUX77_001636 [Berkeleyomyces rouxiae]|uniref:uncharacterized protein n=1 Tax=Berkeleyomyces rouxiae TaxID=2035830 RepID=UPI003B7C1F50